LGVEAKGTPRVNKLTSASLGYPLSVFNKNSTLIQPHPRKKESGSLWHKVQFSIKILLSKFRLAAGPGRNLAIRLERKISNLSLSHFLQALSFPLSLSLSPPLSLSLVALLGPKSDQVGVSDPKKKGKSGALRSLEVIEPQCLLKLDRPWIDWQACLRNYGVATVTRIDKFIGLFCRILSLLWGSFAKEINNFIDPTNHSHPILES